MAYHPTECIFDMLASCGPETLFALQQECSTQCTTKESTSDALTALVCAGVVAVDEDYYDLTSKGYQLADEWNTWLRARDLPKARQGYVTDFRMAFERLTAKL